MVRRIYRNSRLFFSKTLILALGLSLMSEIVTAKNLVEKIIGLI